MSEKLRSHVADEHRHGRGVDRRFDEPKMPVEALGFLFLGVGGTNPIPTVPVATSMALNMKCMRGAAPTPPLVPTVDPDADGRQLPRLVASNIPRGE